MLNVCSNNFCEVQCVKGYYNQYMGAEDYAFIMPQMPSAGEGKFVFDGGTGKFEQFADGTARLTGRLVNKANNTQKLDVDIWFKERRSWAEWSAYDAYPTATQEWKGDAATVNGHYVNWDYYLIDSGTDGPQKHHQRRTRLVLRRLVGLCDPQI